MKKNLNLLLAASLVLAAGCATPHDVAIQHIPPPAIVSPAADLLIISATYGSGTNYADVTYRVNDLIHQPGVEFFSRPEWLQADPTPGWNKALVIVYELKGHRHTFTAGEGGKVSVEILIQQADK